jgi:hypothetical protein
MPYTNLPINRFPGDGQNYCLNCCDNQRLDYFFKETWDLYCPPVGLPPTIKSTNLTDYQFQFARLKTPEDLEIIKCELPRTGGVLIGYHVVVQVTEKSSSGEYWVGYF